jgi:hypothetical protein
VLHDHYFGFEQKKVVLHGELHFLAQLLRNDLYCLKNISPTKRRETGKACRLHFWNLSQNLSHILLPSYFSNPASP